MTTYIKMSLNRAREHLDQLRGRARTRTLNYEDLLQALEEARTGDYGLRAGSTVANAYGYPSRRMRLVAIRRDSGTYAILADWGNAAKSCSPCPLGGRQSWWERELRECKTKLNGARWIIIPGHKVRRALAQRRVEARKIAESQWPEESCPNVPVSISDSLKAGNCVQQTQRVADWFESDTVNARTLRAAIIHREPTLMDYAKRAVEIAAQRVS